ncbi:hypothetical protein DDW01_01255 [Sulfolobus sp. SCGC AB-777_G05]|nr:hypothetical protein DDW01_01255 [Sulfolobus sp. SCGC AB-777_G05]
MSDAYLEQIITKLKEDKVIDSTVEYLYILKMIRDIWLNDEVIKELGSLLNSILALVPIVEKLSEFLSDPEIVKIIDAITSEDTIKIIQNPEKMGLTRLLSEMRNENFQRGLGILIKIIEKIGEATKSK